MKKLTIFLIIIMTLSSCQDENEVQEVIIENRYSLAIPAFLTQVNNLNEDASLQYQNAWKELYVIVIDENKVELQKALNDNGLENVYTDDLIGFSNLHMDSYKNAFLISKKSEFTEIVVNNMPGRIISINGTMEGTNVFVTLAFIEGKKSFYHILSSTLSSKEINYKDMMNKIPFSLREL